MPRTPQQNGTHHGLHPRHRIAGDWVRQEHHSARHSRPGASRRRATTSGNGRSTRPSYSGSSRRSPYRAQPPPRPKQNATQRPTCSWPNCVRSLPTYDEDRRTCGRSVTDGGKHLSASRSHTPPRNGSCYPRPQHLQNRTHRRQGRPSPPQKKNPGRCNTAGASRHGFSVSVGLGVRHPQFGQAVVRKA